MFQNSCIKSSWAGLMLAAGMLLVAPGSAFAAPFETWFDDSFDDGSLSNNVNGVGSGWDWLRQGTVASVTELALPEVARFSTGVDASGQNSYGWALLNSRDTFSFWDQPAAQPVVVEWTVSSIDITSKQTLNDPDFVDLIMEYGIISGAYDSATDQVCSMPNAVGGDSGSATFKGPRMHLAARATAENGYTEIGTSSATHQLRLRDNSNALIVLAEFNLVDTLPMGTGYTVRVELSGDGYAWSFDQAVDVVAGSLSGAWAGLDVTGAQGFDQAGVFGNMLVQRFYNAIGTVELDRFTVVNVIPEPSAMMLLLAAAGLPAMRRRRR